MEAMPQAATHPQGSYVVLKLLDVAEAADLLPLASKLFPMANTITGKDRGQDTWKGITVMCKLVERMVWSLLTPPLCGSFCC
jgi:hypothetical protein